MLTRKAAPRLIARVVFRAGVTPERLCAPGLARRVAKLPFDLARPMEDGALAALRCAVRFALRRAWLRRNLAAIDAGPGLDLAALLPGLRTLRAALNKAH